MSRLLLAAGAFAVLALAGCAAPSADVASQVAVDGDTQLVGGVSPSQALSNVAERVMAADARVRVVVEGPSALVDDGTRRPSVVCFDADRARFSVHPVDERYTGDMPWALCAAALGI